MRWLCSQECEDDEDAWFYIPENGDTAWQRCRLMQQEDQIWQQEYEIRQQTPLEQLATICAATFGFLFILHYYLLHAGGGLVIVPEGDGLGIYNFQELKHMENTHLLKLGLPMPVVPPPPAGLFRWSFLTATGVDTGADL